MTKAEAMRLKPYDLVRTNPKWKDVPMTGTVITVRHGGIRIEWDSERYPCYVLDLSSSDQIDFIGHAR